MKSLRRFLPFALAAVIIFGGVAFWKYSGADAAVKAQDEIRKTGLYYSGETWMSPEDFSALKQSLSTRDSSLKTLSDLEILPEVNEKGMLHIKYSFFSVENYSELNGSRDFPPAFRFGFSFIPTVFPVLVFTGLLAWAFVVLMRGTVKEKKAV
jgi:hypothetical protein